MWGGYERKSLWCLALSAFLLVAFCKQKKKRQERGRFILCEIVAITFKGDAGYLIKKLNTFKKSFNSKDNKSIIILKENQEIKSDELKIKRGRLCAIL